MGPALVQGASRGIGLQFCRALIGRGMTVIACCRDPSRAESLQRLQSEHPGKVEMVALDVSSESGVEAAALHLRHSGHTALDLLINCSGMLSPTGRGETSLRDVSQKGLEETFAVNTHGPLIMAKHFHGLLQAGEGTIGQQAPEPKERHAAILINMSARVGSIADNGFGGWYSYRMSKAALNMATKNLSIELGRGRKKVVCVALHPGTVDTDLTRPYHKNIKGKMFSPEQSVNHLLRVVDGLSLEDTGKYYAWDGSEIPF